MPAHGASSCGFRVSLYCGALQGILKKREGKGEIGKGRRGEGRGGEGGVSLEAWSSSHGLPLEVTGHHWSEANSQSRFWGKRGALQ